MVTWSTLIPVIITAGAALLGVRYGARLSKNGETLSWTREQRLKAYAELLQAIENCYEAFELIAASLSLCNYDEKARQDPKVIKIAGDWGKWDSEIDRNLPQAELVCSKDLQPYVTYIRVGMRSRHRMLLMKLSHGMDIDKKEWESVASMTHGDILKIRHRLREDITHIDSTPSSIRAITFRWRLLHRKTAQRFSVSRRNELSQVEQSS